tara:strand:- start:159 stop:923 length:765 start_codon:yes stop_codon:yes gene_type:complete
MKNYYHILGLSFDSKPENSLIDAAYKALVKLYHPDIFKGNNKDLKRKITEINEAYDTLSDFKKKTNYDEQLNSFHTKNSYDFSDFHLDDSEKFNEKFFNSDWEIATIVYPELEKKIFKLALYSKKLTLQFQFYLLETKKFHQNDEIMSKFLDAFIEKKFGTSKIINKLSKHLIENKNKKEAIYLNKLVKVVGSKSEKKIVDAFFKQYPDIEYEFQIKNKQIKRKNFLVINNEIFQKIILCLAIFLLILFLVYSS